MPMYRAFQTISTSRLTSPETSREPPVQPPVNEVGREVDGRYSKETSRAETPICKGVSEGNGR